MDNILIFSLVGAGILILILSFVFYRYIRNRIRKNYIKGIKHGAQGTAMIYGRNIDNLRNDFLKNLHQLEHEDKYGFGETISLATLNSLRSGITNVSERDIKHMQDVFDGYRKKRHDIKPAAGGEKFMIVQE